MKIIVVEGGDGTGKSTLAHALEKDLGYGFVHMSIPDPIDQPYRYWLKRALLEVRRATRAGKGGIIIDRLHWSEDVYGALRGGSKLTAHERWLLEGWLLAHDARVIRCTLSRDEAWANALKNPTAKHHDKETFDRVYDGYERPWTSLVKRWTYNYGFDDYENVMGALTLTGRGLPATHQGIGTSSPGIVFVGEQHNGCETKTCADPMVFQGQSGVYLRQALALAGLDLNNIHLVNAFHGGKRLDIPFKEARIVTLGGAADRAISTEHGTVPHPQWFRRFCYNEIDEYARMLREAAA